MMKKLISSVIFSAGVAMVSGCSMVYDKHVEWQTTMPEAFPVIHAVGYAPISIQKSDNETQRMLMAVSASKIAAYADLAEQVYGQKIHGKTTMSDLLLQNQQLQSTVQGVIRGAKVVRSYAVGDTYTTELTLNFEDVYHIVEGTVRKREIKDVRYF